MAERGGYFSVNKRNPGHWDISDGHERAFRIRGEPGRVTVLDERSDESEYGKLPRAALTFPDVRSAMAYVAFQFMSEPGHP